MLLYKLYLKLIKSCIFGFSFCEKYVILSTEIMKSLEGICMMKELQVKLVPDKCVCEVVSDSLITAVDSKGIWCGQVDVAIRENIGDYYHQALLGHITQKSGMPMFEDGQVLEIKGEENHKGPFDNIIFVIDDVKKPLSEIIYNGLAKANKEGTKIVTMSCIRAGESYGKKETSFEEMATEVYKGIKLLLNNEPEINIKRLLMLTYDNYIYQSLLLKQFNKDEQVVAIY